MPPGNTPVTPSTPPSPCPHSTSENPAQPDGHQGRAGHSHGTMLLTLTQLIPAKEDHPLHESPLSRCGHCPAFCPHRLPTGRRRGWGRETRSRTSLCLDELLPHFQGHKGRAVQDYVGDGPPGVGGQSLRRRNEVAGCIVYHNLAEEQGSQRPEEGSSPRNC